MRFAREDPYWLVRFVFLMGTHFCALVPFHFDRKFDERVIDDPRPHRRPRALYCDGITWLKRTIAMLEGAESSFAGVPFPEVPSWTSPRQPLRTGVVRTLCK